MIYDIILNIEKSGIKPRIKVSQYDKTLPQIHATLYSNNQAFNIPSGSKVYISGTKKDNTGFKYECTYSNNEITADITEQMTAFSGDVEVEFTIESSGSRKGTENFILEVEPAALEDDVIISETDIPALQRLSQPASTTQLGVIKVDGTSVTVDEDGTLHSSGGGGGAVQSVNGKTGTVVLDADDIDDSSTTNKFTNATEKQAWNGKSTVSVTQIKSSGEKIATINVNGTDTDLYASAGGGGGGAVDSVNGKTGDVVLTASDVGALADNTPIPSDLSDLSDVDTSGVTDGQILKYNATSGKFLPGNESGGGTTDYTDLTNKPSINGVTLSGNKTSADLGISGADDVSAILNVYGSKNLNVYPYQETTETLNGVTFRDNGDGSITVSGATTSAYAVFSIRLDGVSPFKLKKGTYKLSGCPNKSGLSIVFQFNVNGETISAVDTGSGATFTLTADAITKWCYLYVDSNIDLTTAVTFYPMLRDARITDDTYVPYAMTNRELTTKTSGLTNPNLLDNAWFTVNQRGVTSGNFSSTGDIYIDRWHFYKRYTNAPTFTINSNGLTVSGIESGVAGGYIRQFFEQSLIGKTVTFSVLYSDGTISTNTVTIVGNAYVLSDGKVNFRYVDGNDYSLWIYFDADCTLRAVKMEIGTVSTLSLDMTPNYTEELLKCQRYFYPLGGKSYNAMVSALQQTRQWFTITLPTEMRAVPTFSGSLTSEGISGSSPMTDVVTSSNVTVTKTQDIDFNFTTSGNYNLCSCARVSFASGSYLSAEL